MATEVHIAGLKQLANALRELPRAVAAKRLRSPVAQAAIMIRDDARRRAPIAAGLMGKDHPPPGTLRRAILVAREAGNAMTARYIVGVRHGPKYKSFGKGHKNVDAFYWWWVERGTSHSAPQPFLKPAYEANKDAALGVIVQGILQGVEEEAKRLAWRTPT